MRIVTAANGRRVLSISRVEWLRIGKQLGIDMNHPAYRRVFIDGFISRFAVILGTLRSIQKGGSARPDVIDNDVRYLKSLYDSMPADDSGIKDRVGNCIKSLETCLSFSDIVSSVSGCIKKIEEVVDFLKNPGSAQNSAPAGRGQRAVTGVPAGVPAFVWGN